MAVPDFSKPRENCYLTTDKNNSKLKVGDVVTSTNYSVHGGGAITTIYKPIEEYNGELVIPHCGSFLVSYYVREHCELVSSKIENENK
jgi:hypothetical protein